MSHNIPDKVLFILEKWEARLDTAVRLISYLKYFGYLLKDGEFSVEDLQAAIIKLQADAGIVMDGEAGPKTLAVMDWPRCGCPENMLAENATDRNKWRLSELTYFIQGRDTDLSAAKWDEIIAEAFAQWEAVANIKFKRVSSTNANLIIGIGSGRGSNFDGPSGTLAWAYLPPSVNYRGQLQMKFDTGETWVDLSASRGIRLLNVACHEFGHMLGLGHSRVNSALMAPFYARDIIKPQQNDDIFRIQNLYGKPVATPTVPNPPKPDVPANPQDTIIRISGTVDSVSIDGYRVQKMD